MTVVFEPNTGAGRVPGPGELEARGGTSSIGRLRDRGGLILDHFFFEG